MTDMKIEPKVTVSAVVIRADGTVEDLGVVAVSDDTPEMVEPSKRRN